MKKEFLILTLLGRLLIELMRILEGRRMKLSIFLKMAILLFFCVFLFSATAQAQMCFEFPTEASCKEHLENPNPCYWCPTICPTCPRTGIHACNPFPTCPTCDRLDYSTCLNSPLCHWVEAEFQCVANSCGNGVFDPGPAGEQCDGTAGCNNATCTCKDWYPDGNGNCSSLLVVNKAGYGTGTVTSSPAGINCGSDCWEFYPIANATVVTLTAVPDLGYGFTGWSGAGCTGTGTCTVTMNASRTVTATFGNVNRPPVLDPVGDKQAYEGQIFQFNITASDSDGDALTYSAGNLPTGATFVGQTFTWTPGYDQAGNYTNVLFTVTDNGTPPMSASEAITITVGNVNRPPVLNPIGNKTVNEGDTLQFTITASDPDGDTLTYSTSNLPGDAFFDPITQKFTWTPGYDQAGSYPNVLFIATDNGTPPLSASAAITITVGNVNRPPVLGPIGSRTVNEGKPLTIVITATDPDGGGSLTLPATCQQVRLLIQSPRNLAGHPAMTRQGTIQMSFSP